MTDPTGGVTAVIQARMGSSRLPGKVLLDLGGRSVLSWVIRAARASGVCDQIVVATTEQDQDDAIVDLALSEGVVAHRGPVDDVLGRFVGAVAEHRPDAVLRLTADCPLLDPALIAVVVKGWHCTRVDYASTVAPRTLPRGLDVELVSYETLMRLHGLATAVDRTHVTSFIGANPDLFTSIGISIRPPASDLRVTLDTPEDLELLTRLAHRIGPEAPSWRKVVDALRSAPELVEINRAVRQKAVVEG